MKETIKKNEKSILFVAVTLLTVVCLASIYSSNRLGREIPSDTLAMVEQPKIEEQVQSAETTEIIAPEVPEPVVVAEPKVVPNWPVEYSMQQAALLDVVVNKKHKLPNSFKPSLKQLNGGYLRPEVANDLVRLLNAAASAGISMKVISSYRSYDTQVQTYNKWVATDGKAQADRSSARAGHSEHQTGLAVDLGNADGSCDLEICFGDSVAGKWLAVNSAKYGFIIRYDRTTEAITGYQYEPWHLRYLGMQLAEAVSASAKTMEEYYSVEGGDY